MNNQLYCKESMTIIPNENLFLGGGKIINKSENQWLTTSVIPNPSVFFGAICSAMLSENECRRKKYIDQSDEGSDPREFLTLGRISLTDGESLFVQAPLDLFIEDDFGGRKIVYGELRNINSSVMITSATLDNEIKYLFFNICKKDSQRADEFYIKQYEYYNCYYNELVSMHAKHLGDILTNSYKVGIKIDKKTGTAQEGMLYRIDLVEFNNMQFSNRFKNKHWGYNVEYKIDARWWGNNIANQSVKILSDGYLKLGGENKICKFTTKSYTNIYDMSCYKQINSSQYVKLVVRIPVMFKEDKYYPSFKIDSIKVIACSTGKSKEMGGFDIKLNTPKPMIKLIPEGSVYVLKSDYFKDKKICEISDFIETNILLEDYSVSNGDFIKFDVVPLEL